MAHLSSPAGPSSLKRAISVIDLNSTSPPASTLPASGPVRGKEWLLLKVDELERAMRDHLVAAGLVLRFHADVKQLGGALGASGVRAPKHLLDELERTKEEYAWVRAELEEYMVSQYLDHNMTEDKLSGRADRLSPLLPQSPQHLILTAPPESPLPTPLFLPIHAQTQPSSSWSGLLPSALPPSVGGPRIQAPAVVAGRPSSPLPSPQQPLAEVKPVHFNQPLALPSSTLKPPVARPPQPVAAQSRPSPQPTHPNPPFRPVAQGSAPHQQQQHTSNPLQLPSSPADSPSPVPLAGKPRPKPKPRLAPGVIANAAKGGLAGPQGVTLGNGMPGFTRPGGAGGLGGTGGTGGTGVASIQQQQHQLRPPGQQQGGIQRAPSPSAPQVNQQRQQQQQRASSPSNNFNNQPNNLYVAQNRAQQPLNPDPTLSLGGSTSNPSSHNHVNVDDNVLAAMGINSNNFSMGPQHVDNLTSDQAKAILDSMNERNRQAGVGAGAPLQQQRQQMGVGGQQRGGMQRHQQRPGMQQQQQRPPQQRVQQLPPPQVAYQMQQQQLQQQQLQQQQQQQHPTIVPANVPAEDPSLADLGDLSGMDFSQFSDLFAEEPEGGWDALLAGMNAGQ